MKIMVGYDGSNEAKNALKLAQKRANALGAKIEVVKAVIRKQPIKHSLIQAAEEKFKWEIQNRLNGNNINFETHLIVSSHSAGRDLVWFAELKNVEEIIIGARKRSKVGKLLLGSVAQYVVLHAPCPVITVK